MLDSRSQTGQGIPLKASFLSLELSPTLVARKQTYSPTAWVVLCRTVFICWGGDHILRRALGPVGEANPVETCRKN